MSITLTRFAAGEFRVLLPVVGGIPTQRVEWRLKTNPTGTWSIHGVYARDFSTSPSTDIQLSDPADDSLYEYAIGTGLVGAPVIGFDYVGLVHGHETLLSATLKLENVSVLGWAVGASEIGTQFVVEQAMNSRLPKNADGTPNDVLICGSSTMRHTFSVDGLFVEHTHIMSAGYVARGAYTAALPLSATNFNHVRPAGIALIGMTGLGDGILTPCGRAASCDAWHSTLHPYWMTMTLPSGGPDLAGDWTYAAPDYATFEDGSVYAKFRVLVQGTDIALVRNLGTVSASQLYVVSTNTGHAFAGNAYAANAFDVEPVAAPIPCQTITTVTLAAIKDLLAQKWESVPFWTAEEARLAFNEAMRVYNLLTGVWKRRVAITTTAGQVWVPVPSTLVYNLRMDYDERPLGLSCLGDLDNGRPGWETETTASGGSVPTRPQLFAPAGLSLVAIWPADAVGGHTLVVDGVRQTPTLAADGDVAAITVDDLGILLGEALHVAALKLGGTRFAQTQPFHQAFLSAALDRNDRLRHSAFFRKAMGLDVNRGMRPMRTDATGAP